MCGSQNTLQIKTVSRTRTKRRIISLKKKIQEITCRIQSNYAPVQYDERLLFLVALLKTGGPIHLVGAHVKRNLVQSLDTERCTQQTGKGTEYSKNGQLSCNRRTYVEYNTHIPKGTTVPQEDTGTISYLSTANGHHERQHNQTLTYRKPPLLPHSGLPTIKQTHGERILATLDMDRPRSCYTDTKKDRTFWQPLTRKTNLKTRQIDEPYHKNT